MAKKKKDKSNKGKKSTPKVNKVAAKVVTPHDFMKPLNRKIAWIALGFFTVLSFILYWSCLKYGYVLDDKLAITENNYTKKGLSGIWLLLSTDTFMGYLGEVNSLLPGGRYRPLSLISFAIEYQIFGLNSKVSHFINVLLYGLSGFICFITLRRLFSEKTYAKKALVSFSFLVATLFILHPIHTEAVANIKGRDEIMAFIFSMLALLYALKYIDTQKIKYLLIMLGVFFLGLFSKENTITFLAIIPFAILLFRKKDNKISAVKKVNHFSMKSLITIAISLLVITIVYLFVRFSIIDMFSPESKDVMNNPFVGMSGIEKHSTIMYTLLVYIKLCVFPHPLTHDYYPYHIPIVNLGHWKVMLSILVHLLMTGAIFFFWKKHKKIAFGFGFYLAAISIVSNVVVSVGTFMNERFAFMASLGVCIILVYLLERLCKKINKDKYKNILLVLLAVIGIAFAIKTIVRVPAWESELALNRQAIKVSKNSARANSFMATALFNRYKEISDPEEKSRLLNEAEPYAQKASSILPLYKNARLMQSGIAAEKYKADNDLDTFLASFKDIITYRPDVEYLTTYIKYLNGRADANKLKQFHLDIKNILVSQNKKDWALHFLLIANEGNAGDPDIRKGIYEILMSMGKTAEAQNFQ